MKATSNVLDFAVSPAAPVVSGASYRDAMSRLPTAVSIVTTRTPAGMAGFTASAVCSVTDVPPTLLVCLNHAASVYTAFASSDVLCVNVASAGQQSVVAAFGGRTAMDDRFAAAQWHALCTGSPVLLGAAAAFDCRIVKRLPVGTHDVLFCEVLALSFDAEPQALAYFGRKFHRLVAA
ncbi:flavin reductase [Variovorax sp. VNK109]|uniref:flavin reductase n=1 Tax=Variovorax sp. VNK109 TaxID=3400919 RepID=UPI003BFF3CE7